MSMPARASQPAAYADPMENNSEDPMVSSIASTLARSASMPAASDVALSVKEPARSDAASFAKEPVRSASSNALIPPDESM